MYAINGASRHVYRRVKTKSEIGAGKIVIDGLGHSDDFHALLVQLLGDR